jgi:methylated-DNA-[protein]-cysteine S-methyltransferase
MNHEMVEMAIMRGRRMETAASRGHPARPQPFELIDAQCARFGRRRQFGFKRSFDHRHDAYNVNAGLLVGQPAAFDPPAYYIFLVMSELGFALFETAIGRCGIVWSERGIVAVRFPERGEDAVRNRITQRFPHALEAAPSDKIRRAIDDIVALLKGEQRDLKHIEVDLGDAPDFNRRVYEVARAIPPGKTLSYGEVAERLGDRNLARDVAQALGQNPVPIIVPCHRVMAAGRKTGGFSAPGGVQTKLKLLSIEGAQLEEAPMLFDRLPLVAQKRPRG